MIKVYFDWNVLSQIQNGSHPELNEIILNDTKLFIPFSTSHITDISQSFSENQKQKELIDRDLEFISTVTRDFCLYNHGKGIVCDLYPPKELFVQTIEDKDLLNDLSFEGLRKTFEGDETAKKITEPLFDILEKIPIEESFKEAFKNPESADMMANIFPGLKDNLTMGGFFKSFSQMNFNLNESDGYKALRQTVQKGLGIKRDKIFDTNDPFDFIQKSYDKIGFSVDQFLNKSEHAPKWFNDISNEYIKLDIHGYQEDRVNTKKGRKETFKNTTEDSFHAAFASTCNIYVINDKRSFEKTIKVFEKLNINTAVYKPKDFIDFYNEFLGNQNPKTDLKIIENLLSSGNFHEATNESGVFRTFYFPYFLFGFFNKLAMFHPTDESDEPLIFLSQDKPTNWFVIPLEVKELLDRLLIYFGPDLNNEGSLKIDEFEEGNWSGRKWKMNDLTLRLIAVNNYIQLYWDFETVKASK